LLVHDLEAVDRDGHRHCTALDRLTVGGREDADRWLGRRGAPSSPPRRFFGVRRAARNGACRLVADRSCSALLIVVLATAGREREWHEHGEGEQKYELLQLRSFPLSDRATAALSRGRIGRSCRALFRHFANVIAGLAPRVSGVMRTPTLGGVAAALSEKRFLLAILPATLAVALVTGIPTDVLPNPWFQRMTPVRTLDVVLWPLISLASGSLLATYALPGANSGRELKGGAGGGLLGVFAIGCPVCNKLVVAAIGVSGALTFFEPIQPLLGVLAVAIPLLVLRWRLAVYARGCSAQPLAAPPAHA
jgi:hypothetical protein